MVRFHVTYGIVTPESAENGDYAEHGFLDKYGSRHSIETVKDGAQEYELTLREAMNLCSPHWDSGSWFDQESYVLNYRTSEECSLSLHPPRNITSASYERIARLLGVRK